VKRYLEDHPTIRGFAIIAAIALAVVVLSLQAALVSLFLLARIAFFLAIAFFIYLFWRERRGDIAVWPRRAYVAFYGAAIVMVVAFGYYVLNGASGMDAAAFLIILGLCGFAMWRVWRDQHTFS
jgi:uncharacterized membrane protein YhhN